MQLDGPWLFKVDSLDKGLQEQWFNEGYNRSDWTTVKIPEYWDRYNLETYDGFGWFTTEFHIDDITHPLVLLFGGVDDDAQVWVNGKEIGTHIGYSEPFYFELGEALRKGSNNLVVRVNDYSGPGGIYKPVSVIPLSEVDSLLQTEYSKHPARWSEDWVKDAVIYEVYLRSFSKEGTFKALERRLPELKDLGVTVLWIMPIHPVGELNRKGRLGSPYAVQDYYGVDPTYGTMDDFRSLVRAVHAQGMKIIIDMVANHTAWDAKLMMEHPEWYTTNKQGEIVSPNADWHDVADLNYDNHELRKYMIDMLEYWVRDIGIDGYRCDVAELVPTDFWDRTRKELDKIKPIMMLSEGTLPEHHMEAFNLTYSWNMYDVLEKIIKGKTPVRVFDEMLKNEARQFPRGSLRMRFNTNHDKNAWDAPAVEKFTSKGAKATAVLAFTFPGVPLIYNGEEVGNEKRLKLFEKVEIDWKKNLDFRQFYRQLGALRANHPALRRGEFEGVRNSDNEKVYSFIRRNDGDRVLVVINFSQQPKEIEISLPATMQGGLKEYFSGATTQPSAGSVKVALGGLEYGVFIPQNSTAQQ